MNTPQMDVDTPSSSPSSRLSVVCSGSADYSSNVSESSSPTSRRGSVSEAYLKDESYWEKRKRNNDSVKRSREKRRMNDIVMEQRLLELSQENQLLKCQLESRTASDSLLSTSRTADFPSLPSASQTVYEAPKLQSLYNPLVPNSSLLLPSSSNQLPMLQLCQLQAALQNQYRTTPSLFPLGAALPSASLSHSTSSLSQPSASLLPSNTLSTVSSSSGSLPSAFQPFNSQQSVIKSLNERNSPDSSSDNLHSVHRAVSPSSRPQQSLLGALLSNRRPSPTVPQSSTEHRSGLATPPALPQMADLKCHMPLLSVPFSTSSVSSKSDSESNSSASLSPSEHSALQNALGGGEGRKQQYMDRRKRNNEAAKRCRANRRAIFDYRSRRVQVLEGENDDLKREVSDLKREIDQFKALIAARNAQNGQ